MAFRRHFVGQVLPVVVLNERDKGTGNLVGLSDNYIKVLFQGPDTLKHRWTPVEIQKATGFGAEGKVLEAFESPTS
jgi:threonylcarbamoyladenosine tRNA methylthiotransferase MtaB